MPVQYCPAAPKADVMKLNGSVRLLRSSVERIEEVTAETGIPRAALIRLCVAEGLRSLFPAENAQMP
jgi:hypothetical protein